MATRLVDTLEGRDSFALALVQGGSDNLAVLDVNVGRLDIAVES